MDILSKIQTDAHIKELSDYGNKTNKITKGKILKVKPGYNPNSSSMGSIIYSLPQIMLGLTAIFGVVSGLIIARFMNKQPVTKQDVKNKDKK